MLHKLPKRVLKRNSDLAHWFSLRLPSTPPPTVRDEAQAKRGRPDKRDLAQFCTEEVGGALAGVAEQIGRHEFLLVADGACGRVVAYGIAHTGRQRADGGMGKVHRVPRDWNLTQP